MDTPKEEWISPQVSNTPMHNMLLYICILGDICRFCGQDTSYVGGLGASAHLSGFQCLSVHILDVHYASYCAFLVVYYVSNLHTMATTTTPPVNVVSSGMSSLSSMMAPSLMGLPTTLGQHDMVLLPPLIMRCSGGVLGLASVPQQQPPSLMPLQAYANYAMGSPQVGFFFRVEHPAILYVICLISVLVSAFYFQVPCWMPYSPLRAQPLGFSALQPLGVYHGRHMCNLMMVIGPHQICTEWLLPPLH